MGFELEDGRLLMSFVRSNLRDRFLGSALGRVWAVANPLLLLVTFTFIFGFVFKARLPGMTDSTDYAIWFVAGYGTWLGLVDSIMSSTVSVVAASSLVRNLPFKTELLPMAGALMGIVPLGVSLLFLLVLLALNGTPPQVVWLWVLPVVVFQFLLVAGLGMFLASLNVFVRDISMVLPNLLLLLLFASPIFYPISALPTILREVSRWNPFYVISEGFRQPLVFGSAPSLWSLIYLALLSVLLFAAGLKAFRRYKPYFDGYL